MAEVAGLVLGAVAVASLFQTCVEFLEYFEVARNLSEDGERVSTKFNLLETRLRNCGNEMKVLADREDGGWHAVWADEGGIIGRCLLGIRDILGDASKLRYKYGLDKRKRLGWKRTFPFRLRPPQKAKANPFSGTVSLRRHVVWAIRDKKRLDSLIQDLDFFITNLEKVSTYVARLDIGSNLSVSELQHGSMSPTQTIGNTLGRQFGPGRTLGPAPVQGNRCYNEQSIVARPLMVGVSSKYKDQQSKNESSQNVGTVGDTPARQNEFNGQVAHDRSYQQVGDTTEAFAARLFPARK